MDGWNKFLNAHLFSINVLSESVVVCVCEGPRAVASDLFCCLFPGTVLSYQQRTNTQIRRTQKNTHTNSFLLSTHEVVMIAASCPNEYIFKLTKEEKAVLHTPLCACVTERIDKSITFTH